MFGFSYLHIVNESFDFFINNDVLMFLASFYNILGIEG